MFGDRASASSSVTMDHSANGLNGYGADPVATFEAKLEEFRRSDNERDELMKVKIVLVCAVVCVLIGF